MQQLIVTDGIWEMRGSFPAAATCDDAVGRKSPMKSSDRRCYLLQQGSDLLHAVCKCSAVSPATLARLACTCTTLRHVASGEEVWVQVRACACAHVHMHVCMQSMHAKNNCAQTESTLYLALCSTAHQPGAILLCNRPALTGRGQTTIKFAKGSIDPGADLG